MIRLVKLNLYNYRIYNAFVDRYVDEFNNSLIFESFKNIDFKNKDTVLNFFIHNEKKILKNSIRTSSYFILETNSNSFLGIAQIKENVNNKQFELIYDLFKEFNKDEVIKNKVIFEYQNIIKNK